MATRFSDLPRELRTAYHGTNSLFLPSIRKNGLMPIPYPLIEKAIAAARELVKEVERTTPKKEERHYLPSSYSALVLHGQSFISHISRTKDVIPISSSKKIAAAYAGRSPEVVSIALHFFLEDFVLKLNEFYASEFNAEQNFKQLYSRVTAHFAKGTPMVLTVEIPSLAYIRHPETRKIPSVMAVEAVLKTQNPENPELKDMPLSCFGSGLTLAKSLGPEYILKVESAY